MNRIKICCLTYRGQDQLVAAAVRELHDEEIEVVSVNGVLEEIVDKVQHEIINGAEILLAGGVNARTIKGRFALPVLEYKISDFDILFAVSEGFNKGKKPALVTYCDEMPEKLKKYLQAVGKDLMNIVYEDGG